MPSSRSSSNSSHCSDTREHRHRHRERDNDYYYYEYEYGPNPLAIYLLSRPLYGGLGYGYGGLGYGYGGLGYGGLGYGYGYGYPYYGYPYLYGDDYNYYRGVDPSSIKQPVRPPMKPGQFPHPPPFQNQSQSAAGYNSPGTHIHIHPK